MNMESKPSVLIVDDDEVCREEIYRLLGTSFQFYEAATGSEALQTLTTQQVDCVLLDYRLPDSDGVNLLLDFAELDVSVVMMTAEGSEQIAVEAMKRGAHDYLVKSTFTENTLKIAIENAIKHAALARKVSEQQEELELFASATSHDLKSPLRTIGVYAGIIKQDIDESNFEQVAEHCQRITKSVGTMYRLIDGLLEYSLSGRNQRPFVNVDMNELTNEVVTTLEAAVSFSQAKIEFQKLPVVQGDRNALFQLMQNLISNAIKYRREEEAPHVVISASKTRNHWQFSVADNGIGIEAKYHDNIFKPLKRLHSNASIEGNGLGLAMCMRVAKQHAGKLWVDPQPSEGSTFHFTLPTDQAQSLRPSQGIAA